MNGKELLEAMGQVDERFVEEAETESLGHAIPWGKWISLAACLCLVLLGLFAPRQDIAAGQDEPPQATEGLRDPGSGIPTVVLRVDSLTETGFMGTVVQAAEGETLTVGMSVNVVVEDGSSKAIRMMYEEQTLVTVQVLSYDAETGTLVVK